MQVKHHQRKINRGKLQTRNLHKKLDHPRTPIIEVIKYCSLAKQNYYVDVVC